MSLAYRSVLLERLKNTFQSQIFILSTAMNVNMEYLNYSVILERIARINKFFLCANLHHYFDADFLAILKVKGRFTTSVKLVRGGG